MPSLAPKTFSTPTKKGFSYVLGHSSHNENHILPINATQYSSASQQLYTAGRDGTIKVWSHQEHLNPFSDGISQQNNEQSDIAGVEFYEPASNGEEYPDIDEKILKLETSISSNPLPYSYSRQRNRNSHVESVSEYSIVRNHNIHFDWINDMKLINNDRDLVSCSSDLSIKLLNLNVDDNSITTTTNNFNTNNSEVHRFPNMHTDYIKKLSYNKNTNHLFSGGLDGDIIAWDLLTLKPFLSVPNRSSSMEPTASIYSLANSENLISTGGPNNTINIYDRRSQNPFIRKLIGHQDNIRCLLMNERFILSGSSDTSIKLWDLRNFKVYKNFDIHDYPVWSLSSEDNNFAKFYSGDKGGNIIKTDLSFLSHSVPEEDQFHGFETFNSNDNLVIDEKLGISTIVAKDSSPILSLCWESNEDTLFASNYESLNRFYNPDTNQLSKYQYLRTCLDYSINKENQLNDDLASGLAPEDATVPGQNDQTDLNSDFYDLISHLSMDTNVNTFDIQSTFSAHQHAMFDDKSAENDDEGEYNSMFLNVNGGPSQEFINAFKDEYESQEANPLYQEPIKPVENSQSKFIDNTPVEILLNPIPADQITLIPFNRQPISDYKISAKSIISKRSFNNKLQLLVLYLNGDIKIWDIILCKELQTFTYDKSKLSMVNSKDLDQRLKEMDAIFRKFQTSDTLNNWCEVEIRAGKLLVTVKESSYMNVEVYYDDLIKNYPFLDIDHPENSMLPRNRIKVTDDDRFHIGAVLLNSIFRNYALYEWEFDCKVREEMRSLRKSNRTLSNTPQEDDSDSNSISSSIRKLKKFSKKSSRTNLTNLAQSSGSPASSAQNSVREMSISETPLTEFLNFSDDSPAAVSSSSNVNYDNSIMKLLQTNKRIYWDKYNNSSYIVGKGKSVPSILHVDSIHPSLDENQTPDIPYMPIVNNKRLPQDLLIIIFEYSPDLGNYRDVCSFTLEDIQKIDIKANEKSNLVDELRMQLPRWIGHPILFNRFPQKEHPKIAFQLFEVDYTSLPANKKIGGKAQKKIKKLPVLESSIKLTSHNMLRVSKVLSFLTEKFDSKTSEMKDKKSLPTDWLALECRGEELPSDMTLQTIKTTIWKSSSDIELRFRRKFDVEK
ncbi:Hypothetical WD-40 repeat protein [Scheffersomyces stipitis CBS 6054]|uniref:Hypothetical WD-40 repeat protein n=1 Tax=Scheffersomyces stipitis (strain ATCC 58785 / CBS 6054 / NBRC 10063 / NRRL Y-11545) TaxID=322104 RepID=A3GI05_PICST|nr:Hypothetical WD-40 repeat protein [Scheffersomyces stipitis CBS 6054]EAZ62907.2 Hypothetical WD-40 repeat protein [Scheffersomyces stipitis CBS 6054]